MLVLAVKLRKASPVCLFRFRLPSCIQTFRAPNLGADGLTNHWAGQNQRDDGREKHVQIHRLRLLDGCLEVRSREVLSC